MVTFNQAQQLLILDLLETAQGENPDLERALQVDGPDGVFVKNLENVQGDERDVVIFSVGYGPDPSGRISMNFGPLNKDGGERRLNVAITRARYEVIVFASLRADQIDPARTSAQGVLDLRAFLSFAQRGSSGAQGAALGAVGARERDALVHAIADALTARGHAVEVDVGASDVRVDLAVLDPRQGNGEGPTRYLLGIETDGLNYARAATTRDRDRLRNEVLRRLGWTLHRVWAVDWWREPEVQLTAIEAALKKARGSAEIESTEHQ